MSQLRVQSTVVNNAIANYSTDVNVGLKWIRFVNSGGANATIGLRNGSVVETFTLLAGDTLELPLIEGYDQYDLAQVDASTTTVTFYTIL